MASIAFTSKKTLQIGCGLPRLAQMTLLDEGIGRTLESKIGHRTVMIKARSLNFQVQVAQR